MSNRLNVVAYPPTYTGGKPILDIPQSFKDMIKREGHKLIIHGAKGVKALNRILAERKI